MKWKFIIIEFDGDIYGTNDEHLALLAADEEIVIDCEKGVVMQDVNDGNVQYDEQAIEDYSVTQGADDAAKT